jgi:formylglycine-generating enzyme required for sulfatase activity
MTPTLEKLVTVRSQPAEAMLTYLQRMEEELAKNPLLERFDRRLDAIGGSGRALRLPLRVVSHQPIRDLEEVRAHEHYWEAAVVGDGGGEDAARRVWAFRGDRVDDDIKPEPLDDLEPKLEMAVLLGDPGSGKTEWLKYRARLAMRQTLEQLEGFEVALDDLPLIAYLPLRDAATALDEESALKDLLIETGCIPSRHHTLTDVERAAAAMLQLLVQSYHLPKRLAPWVWKKLNAPPTQHESSNRSPLRLRRGNGGEVHHASLLFLDAWDEVRKEQEMLARSLRAFAQETQTRIFLTSRIIGYDDKQSPLPIDNNPEGARRTLRICPFAWEETKTFVTAFFHDDQERGQEMLGELGDKPSVNGMAQNPLLATLLCMAFSPRSDRPPLSFPARRVEVYQRVLKGLLGEWGETPDGELIAAKLELLEEIAYHFFPDEELSRSGFHKFLWNKKSGYMRELDDLDPLRQRLREQKTTVTKELCNDGILVPCAESFIFLHLTFQEYLTASALARELEPDSRIPHPASSIASHPVAQLARDKSWIPRWQEVLTLLAGVLKRPDELVRYLLTFNPVLAARGIHYGDAKVSDAVRLEVIQALRDTFEDAAKPSYRDDLRVRISAGELLGYLGDTRFTFIDLRAGEEITDDLRKARIWRGEEAGLILPPMVEIPATKKFKMGSTPEDNQKYKAQLGFEWPEVRAADEQPARDVALDAYTIGRYPITYREFEQFVNDDGYTAKWEACWTDGGWKWLCQRRHTAPNYWDNPRFHKPNYPVVGVNWYEAVAYCNWLNAKLANQGLCFRLPTEAEWEYALRGAERRLCAWGDELVTDENVVQRCNTPVGENQAGATTPVGIYPLGATPNGKSLNPKPKFICNLGEAVHPVK